MSLLIIGAGRPGTGERWLAFLRNHREVIAAMTSLRSRTLTFGVLYCFFIISDDRRRVLHFNVTRHLTSSWIVQPVTRSVSLPVRSPVPHFGRKSGQQRFSWIEWLLELPTHTLRHDPRTPWQNRIAERWVGSCRRELLDHIPSETCGINNALRSRGYCAVRVA